MLCILSVDVMPFVLISKTMMHQEYDGIVLRRIWNSSQGIQFIRQAYNNCASSILERDCRQEKCFWYDVSGGELKSADRFVPSAGYILLFILLDLRRLSYNCSKIIALRISDFFEKYNNKHYRTAFEISRWLGRHQSHHSRWILISRDGSAQQKETPKKDFLAMIARGNHKLADKLASKPIVWSK